MAKKISAENLSQAYSVEGWQYSTYNVAYAGFYAKNSVYVACVLRFDVPEFIGISDALDVSLMCDFSLGAEVTLRWALCSSDVNRALYVGTTAEVADENQIASGTVAVNRLNDNVEFKNLLLPTAKIKGGGTYYLFLWAYNDTGVNILAVSSSWGEHSVALSYNIGVLRVKTAAGVTMHGVYVKQGGEIKQMIPYVKTPSGVKPGS